jgi:hypothetical protein
MNNLILKKYLLAVILFSQSPLFASLLPYNFSLNTTTDSTSLFCLNPKSEIIWEKSEEKVQSYNPFLMNLTSNQMRVFSLLNKSSGKKHKKKKTTYSKTKISDVTLKLLSKKSQEGLKKYGSYIDEEGSFHKDFENLIICGDFIVDKSKSLGYGDEGHVYLAQHKTKKYFVAAKSTAINTHEQENLKSLGRLRGVYEDPKWKGSGYLFQDLVDGMSLYQLGNPKYGLYSSSVKNLFGKSLDHHDLAHLSKNLLKEFILVHEKNAVPDEILSGHIMVEKDLTVRFIDFSNIYPTKPMTTPLQDQWTWQKVILPWVKTFWLDNSSENEKNKDYNSFAPLENPYVDFILELNKPNASPTELLNILKELIEQNQSL